MRRMSAALLVIGLGLLGGASPAGAISSQAFTDGSPRGTMTPYGHMGNGCFDVFYSSGAGSQLVGLYVTSTADCGDNLFYLEGQDGGTFTVAVRPGADIVVPRSDLVALGYGQFRYGAGGGGGLTNGDPCTGWYWPAQLVIDANTITPSGCS